MHDEKLQKPETITSRQVWTFSKKFKLSPDRPLPLYKLWEKTTVATKVSEQSNLEFTQVLSHLHFIFGKITKGTTIHAGRWNFAHLLNSYRCISVRIFKLIAAKIGEILCCKVSVIVKLANFPSLFLLGFSPITTNTCIYFSKIFTWSDAESNSLQDRMVGLIGQFRPAPP